MDCLLPKYSYVKNPPPNSSDEEKWSAQCDCNSLQTCSSGDGSSASLQSEERSPAAMAQAVRVHEEINKVMYFAWSHLPMYKTVITFRGPLAEIHMTLCRNRLLSIYIYNFKRYVFLHSVFCRCIQFFSFFFVSSAVAIVCRCIQFSFVDSALSAVYSYLLMILQCHPVTMSCDNGTVIRHIYNYIPMTLCVQWWCYTK